MDRDLTTLVSTDVAHALTTQVESCTQSPASGPLRGSVLVLIQFDAALIGTPVADPKMPIEILRTVHSFDPCMACGVHVLDAEGREVVEVKVQ